MKKIFLILVSVVMINPIIVNASDGAELAAFKQAIRAKYDAKEQAFANNDPSYIVHTFYSDEVISTGPDGTTHMGRAGIKPVYDEVIASDVKITSYYTKVNGNMGWDWVNFHVTTPDPETAPFTFKMLFLWERIGSEWVSHGEMYVMGAFDKDTAKH